VFGDSRPENLVSEVRLKTIGESVQYIPEEAVHLAVGPSA
jgi:hypothetical protein